MSWPQVETALSESRRELCLNGFEINKSLEENEFDTKLFQVTTLNYLTIENSILSVIPHGLSTLTNLQTLSLYSNKISIVNGCLEALEKLKILDLSGNVITKVTTDFSALKTLTTINFSNNQLEEFPEIKTNSKLQVLNLSNNAIKVFPNICHATLTSLCDVNLNNNQIEEIPDDIKNLSCLKSFDISSNKLTVVPAAILNCLKLKDLNLKNNPIKDRRLFKLIDQCWTKQILDYMRQQNPIANGGKKKSKKGFQRTISEASSLSEDKLKLTIKYASECGVKVIQDEPVQSVRPYILCCILHEVVFTPDTFKKFIIIQNKLHEDICDKRNKATIATHDAKKITGDLLYTARKPAELKIQPLNRPAIVTGKQLYEQLHAEADALRKEKKRSQFSGIHKYLGLLKDKPLYACLIRTNDEAVISFPPITNSDITKISPQSTSLFLEVTSNTSIADARKAMDFLVRQTMVLMDKDLFVEQVKIIDMEGNLKFIYPSKIDLNYSESGNICIVRE